MPSLVALSVVRTDAYRLADQENKLARFPEAEVDRYINKGRAEWWDILVSTLGPSWLGKSAYLTTTANSSAVAWPDDFLKFVSADLCTSSTSSDRTPLDAIGLEDTASWANRPSGRPQVYFVYGEALEVYPKANRAYGLWLRYIPTAPQLEEGSDEFDTFNSWGDEYASTYAARRMAIKDGEIALAQALMADLAGIVRRIQALAATRETHAPIRVRDIRRSRR